MNTKWIGLLLVWGTPSRCGQEELGAVPTRAVCVCQSDAFVRAEVKPQHVRTEWNRESSRYSSHFESTVRNMRCTSRTAAALSSHSKTALRSPSPACTSANAAGGT